MTIARRKSATVYITGIVLGVEFPEQWRVFWFDLGRALAPSLDSAVDGADPAEGGTLSLGVVEA